MRLQHTTFIDRRETDQGRQRQSFQPTVSVRLDLSPGDWHVPTDRVYSIVQRRSLHILGILGTPKCVPSMPSMCRV
jgi:hypothetical protein